MATSSTATRHRWYLAGVLAIIGLAAVLRIIPLWSALPYTSYVDEGHILHPAAHLVADRTWDVGTERHVYAYPPLLSEAAAATTAIGGWVTGTDVRAGARETERLDTYDIVEPSQLVWSGRLVDALLSTGTVLVTILLARRLIGRRAALMAGLLAAVLPAMVSRASIVIVDTPATFFVMATVLFAAHVDAARARRRWLYAVLGGVAAGLAFTSKYPSGAVFVVVVVALALDREHSWRERLGRGAVALGAAAVATLATMPALIVHHKQVLFDVQTESDLYRTKSSAVGYLAQAGGPREMGWWLFALALPGVVLLIVWARSRRLTVAWAAFAVPLTIYLATQSYQPFRNVLPLMPFAAVAASATIVGLGRLARRHLHVSRQVVVAGTGVATIALALLLLLTGALPFVRDQSTIVDTRTTAVDFLRDFAQPGERILVAKELAMAPSDIRRLGRHVTVASATGPDASKVDLSNYDFVVTGALPKGADGWTSDERSQPIVSLGSNRRARPPQGWSSNDAVVRIYRVHRGET